MLIMNARRIVTFLLIRTLFLAICCTKHLRPSAGISREELDDCNVLYHGPTPLTHTIFHACMNHPLTPAFLVTPTLLLSEEE